jgi:hypothetical protein
MPAFVAIDIDRTIPVSDSLLDSICECGFGGHRQFIGGFSFVFIDGLDQLAGEGLFQDGLAEAVGATHIQFNTSEASPQTDELRKKVIHCLRRSDAGCWLLDAG